MTIGEFARHKRREIEMSQDVVAQTLNLAHRASVHKLETGKVEWNFAQVEQFASLVGMTLTDFITEYEQS